MNAPSGMKGIMPKSIKAMMVESLRTLKSQNDALLTRQAGLEERIRALEGARRPMAASLVDGGPALWLAGLGAVVMRWAARRRARDGRRGGGDR